MEQYTISDSLGMQAVVLPEKGATVVSLRQGGVEFLHRDPENLDASERPRCGIPFLFPIFGRLKDGRYCWEGSTYAMEIHGFGHTSPWQVVSHSSDTLILTLEDNAQTYQQYPFHFRVTLTFSLTESTLTIRQRYENRDSRPMPYNYGFHPYFLTDKPEHILVETSADTYFDFARGGSPFGHGQVTVRVPEGAPEAGAALMGVHSPTVLRNEAEGKQLTMEFDDCFHTHVLWTQAGKPFLCVEPVNGTANGLNTGVYLTLQPGEVREAHVSFQAEII